MKIISGISYTTFPFHVFVTQQVNRKIAAPFIELAVFLTASGRSGRITNSLPIMKKIGAYFRPSI